MRFEPDLAFSDILVSIFASLGLKWWYSHQHRVPCLERYLHNDPDRPKIHLEAIAFPLNHFGGKIVGSSTYTLFLPEELVVESGQAEVAQFEPHLFIEEEVSWFDAA